jgi:hypothetical protein
MGLYLTHQAIKKQSGQINSQEAGIQNINEAGNNFSYPKQKKAW